MDSLPKIPEGPVGTAAGIVSILLGIAALVLPAVVFPLLVFFLVLFALIVSFGLVRSALADSAETRIHRLTLMIFGIVGILLALFILVAPRLLNVLAKDAFAFWAIIIGMGCIQFVFASQVGMERAINALSGVILLIAGALILLAPVLLTDYLLLVILGIFAILYGISTLWFSRARSPGEPAINHAIYK